MARDMTGYYSRLTDLELRSLRSKKILRGLKLAKSFSWFDIKEKDTLRQQIRWIDAELRCRAEQMKLL